eukprot:COSAG01_NODE_683_length_14253_cov_33.540837_12_plen_207_part_00
MTCRHFVVVTRCRSASLMRQGRDSSAQRLCSAPAASPSAALPYRGKWRRRRERKRGGGGSPADRSAVRLHFFDPDGNGIELFAVSPALDRPSHGGKLDSDGKGSLAGASLNVLTFSHRGLGSCAWSEATVFYEEVLGLRQQSSQELPWGGARMLLPPCHSIYIHECDSSARRCKHPPNANHPARLAAHTHCTPRCDSSPGACVLCG